ncbi:MAG: 50S ribosomal protein L10 [Methanosarcinaceae archaeon]
MATTKEQKRTISKKLEDKINKSKSIVFTSFKGLKVKENEELRQKLRDEKAEYYVVKKTLLNLAFKKKDIKGLDVKNFLGNISVIFGYEDEIAPAKIINKFEENCVKESNGKESKIDFLGGILENKYITAEEVKSLAKLPSKKELYAKIVGSINKPIFSFVNVLAGNLRNFVYVLNAVKDKKNS